MGLSGFSQARTFVRLIGKFPKQDIAIVRVENRLSDKSNRHGAGFTFARRMLYKGRGAVVGVVVILPEPGTLAVSGSFFDL